MKEKHKNIIDFVIRLSLMLVGFLNIYYWLYSPDHGFQYFLNGLLMINFGLMSLWFLIKRLKEQ